MSDRKIVQIDEEKCNGCGQCIPQCAEGALRIVDGKARLVSDRQCDGLGACLGACPQGAITIVEREAEDFDRHAAEALPAHHPTLGQAGNPAHGHACPGAAVMDFGDASGREPALAQSAGGSALTQWPVQLELVPVAASFLDGADLVLAADCVPFAMADFHARLLRGKKLLVGCPKLDDAAYYADKLAEMLRRNDVRSITVVHMEVPCCHGLMGVARRAVAEAGSKAPLREVVVSIRGQVRQSTASAGPGVPAEASDTETVSARREGGA